MNRSILKLAYSVNLVRRILSTLLLLFFISQSHAQQPSFRYLQQDSLVMCVNNISSNGEFGLRGLTAAFPYPILSTITIFNTRDSSIVSGLADTANWLAPDDIAEIGLPISKIWYPLLEYELADSTSPLDQNIYNQNPPPLFTEVREYVNFPTSTMLVMDASYSMRNDISEARDAVLQFVDNMRPPDRAGVIVFDHEITGLQQITDDRERLMETISNATTRGQTALYDALMLAIQETKSEGVRRGIIVYADGEDNSSAPENTSGAVIDSANYYNVPIHSIAFGDIASKETMQRISAETGGLFFETSENMAINEIYNCLSKIIQNFYVMAHGSTDLDDVRNWRVLDLSVFTGDDTVSAKGRFFSDTSSVTLTADPALEMISVTEPALLLMTIR